MKRNKPLVCSTCETKEANILIVSGNKVLGAFCPWCFAEAWNGAIRTELETAMNADKNNARYN